MSNANAGAKETLPEGLAALMARAGSARGPAPVERWDPPYCGEIDMRIAADGRWFYEGGPIGRERLVRLFSTVLRRDEDGHHYLVTPVERVRITVEDAPFLAVELHAQGEGRDQRLTLRTNVGDVVEVGPDTPLRFEDEAQTGGLKPYVRVRGRLDALLSRPLLYQLAEHFREEEIGGEAVLGAWSNGVFFPASAGGGMIARDAFSAVGEGAR
ncbi:MAG: hypothetical protein CMN87_01730 [Stappia sp.]|uniref:DUF1285 domain-containing protein n=1 Tax=Stappia sp. TaxID=1870903 RepID=UPI000C506248|nr:DUF1285 domain-containing protein [Stappia sp.]MAB00636.1 hypothetical protein [Stappia sp.]MBM18706.1 hypothetical protein [Stappia sp.]